MCYVLIFKLKTLILFSAGFITFYFGMTQKTAPQKEEPIAFPKYERS